MSDHVCVCVVICGLCVCACVLNVCLGAKTILSRGDETKNTAKNIIIDLFLPDTVCDFPKQITDAK